MVSIRWYLGCPKGEVGGCWSCIYIYMHSRSRRLEPLGLLNGEYLPGLLATEARTASSARISGEASPDFVRMFLQYCSGLKNTV